VPIASLHLKRPVGVDEFRVWRDVAVERHPQLMAEALAYLECQG
jgi:hypothetical protein